MGAKLILKVLGREFEGEPFFKGFPSIDTCKNFCKSTVVMCYVFSFVQTSFRESGEVGLGRYI